MRYVQSVNDLGDRGSRKDPSGIALVLCILMAVGCANQYVAPIVLTEVATDKTYGYSQGNPVKLGGAAEGQKARHREAFLTALRGPQGQPISYVSHGTCCSFDLGSEGKSRGDLEVLLVTYPGIPKPVLLFLDVYHFEPPKAPLGFGFAASPVESGSPGR